MNQKKKTLEIVKLGMFAAIISILSQLSIPLPSGIPITLQTFALALTGYILGRKRGTYSVLLWLSLGILGLPVYANFRSGIGSFLGYTGGFLISFPFLTFFCGLRSKTNSPFRIFPGILGLAIVHILGISGYAYAAHISFEAAAATASLPYLIKDMVSLVFAWAIGMQVNRRLNIQNLL